MTMKLAVALSLTVGLLAGCQQDATAPVLPADGPAFAASGGGVDVNQIIPWSANNWVPCANGGDGEFVALSGNLHALYNVTFDNHGGVHVKSHYQPQGISGFGSVTGDMYHATGLTQWEYNAVVGQQYTWVNNYRIIGQGPGNNYVEHEDIHVTVNLDGTVITEHDHLSVECK